MLSTKEGLLVKVEWVQLSKFQEIQEMVVVKPVITVCSVDICWGQNSLLCTYSGEDVCAFLCGWISSPHTTPYLYRINKCMHRI